jgi:hypothetical protein
MAALPNDDRMITRRGKLPDRAVCVMDERASRFEDVQTVGTGVAQHFLGGAMGGDHDGAGPDIGGSRFHLDAFGPELADDGFIVDQFAQDGERLSIGLAQGKGDGVAHAEAHAKVRGAPDLPARAEDRRRFQ